MSKWRAPIKNQNGVGPNLKNFRFLQYRATLSSFSTVQKLKMVMMVPCDENPHIMYRWK
jgi:hypothetical protein